jgi:hypothetical protein
MQRDVSTLLLAVVAVCGCARVSPGVGGPPAAVVEPRHIRVEADGSGKVSSTFRVMNRGGSDLVLGKTSTSCGCTVASINPKVVRPGKSALVVITGDPPSAGEKLIQVDIETNQKPPLALVMSLTMIGNAKPPFVVSHNGPIRLDPAPAGTDPELLRIVTREFRSRPPWLAIASGENADVEIGGGVARETPLGPDVVIREYHYEVKMRRVPPPGHFSGTLTFRDDQGANLTHLTIPYHGNVPRPVESYPSRLYASVQPGEQWPRWSLTLTADRGSFDLDAKPVAAADLPFEVRRTYREGRRNRFEVLRRGSVPHSFSGMIRFVTNHPEAPEVRIPMSIRIADPEGRTDPPGSEEPRLQLGPQD